MRVNSYRFYGVLVILLAVIFSAPADAQRRKKKEQAKPKTIYEIDTVIRPIPLNRQGFHDRFGKAIRGADARDGKVDQYIWMGDDTLASNAITQAMLHQARLLDTMVENLTFPDKQTENQTKIGYIKLITNMVNRFNKDAQADPFFYRKVVNNMREMLIARYENRLEAFVQANANIYTLSNIEMLDDYPALRSTVYTSAGWRSLPTSLLPAT
jgi:hypothetical protein